MALGAVRCGSLFDAEGAVEGFDLGKFGLEEEFEVHVGVGRAFEVVDFGK